MDYQTPMIFVALFTLASILLVFVYKYGIKEKSYEEALAEQRQQTQTLLPKLKPKEKKAKKVAKKTKQKENDTNAVSLKEAKIEEEPPLENVPQVEITKNATDKLIGVHLYQKKQVKKETNEAIFFEKSSQNNEETTSDDLLQSNKIEIATTTNSTTTSQGNKVSNSDQPSVNGKVSNTKEKKKKKSNVQQADKLADLNMPILLNNIRNAELSRSEVQVLIELLLNKQHEAPVVVDDWSEGKFDPMQRLKKQLIEKERQLIDEKELAASATSKLREIRAQHQLEVKQLERRLRTVDELLQAKQFENGQMQQASAQAKSQYQEEVLKNQNYFEEIGRLQIQRQQVEIVLNQTKESEVIISNLQRDLQDASSCNAELHLQLKRKNDEYHSNLEQFNMQIEEIRKEHERVLGQFVKQKDSEVSCLTSALNEENRCLKQQYDQNQELNKMVNELKEENINLQNVHVNGTLQETKQHQSEILSLHNQMSLLQQQLVSAKRENEFEIKTATNLIAQLKHDLESERLLVENEKTKNNDLRMKNWKVMDALNSTENKLKSIEIEPKNDQVDRKFVERLFPHIPELSSIESSRFEVESEQLIKQFLSSLKKNVECTDDNNKQLKHLKVQLLHYKNVINNTEEILENLQKHIAQEEINWHRKLSEKNDEIDALKATNMDMLVKLEADLELERKEKTKLDNQILTKSSDLVKTNGLH